MAKVLGRLHGFGLATSWGRETFVKAVQISGVGIAVIFASVYFELFYEICGYSILGSPVGLLQGVINPVVMIRAAGFFVVVAGFCLLIFSLPSHARRVLFKYRYAILLIMAFIGVACEISFSSIGMWGTAIENGNMDGLLFGLPRAIRSDEYNVSTLWCFSQSHNGYMPWTTLLRGDLTDTRLVYNLPSWSLATFFRPLLWGYLLFGSAKGLSWFWIFRCLGTFVSAFECMRVLSRDNRVISMAYAVLITFSPMTLWWGYWDGLIYGQFLVVVLNGYLYSRFMWKRVSFSLLLAWLCGCYVMTLYPAWMVPFFYVFAMMGLIVLIRFVSSCVEGQNQFKAVWLVPIIVGLLICGVCVAWIFIQSEDILTATSSTVYPGARFETGGGGLNALFGYGSSLFFAIQQPSYSNASELASMFSLFPIGSLLFCGTVFKTRAKELLPLGAIQLMLFIYIVFGFPPIISKVTLFSNVPTGRALFAIGYVEIALLCLSLSTWRSTMKSPARDLTPRHVLFILIGCLFISIVLVMLSQNSISGYSRTLFSVLLCCVFVSILLSIALSYFRPNSRSARLSFFLVVLLCVGIPGMCVHPIQKGIAPVTETDLAKDVSAIVVENPSAKWLVEGSWPCANLCASLGAKTVMSTNAYPDMRIWHVLDPDEGSEDVYNRYAHVSVSLLEEGETKIELAQPDAVTLTLAFDDLSKLDISYLVSARDYSGIEVKGVSLKKQCFANGFYIYRVEYLSGVS